MKERLSQLIGQPSNSRNSAQFLEPVVDGDDDDNEHSVIGEIMPLIG